MDATGKRKIITISIVALVILLLFGILYLKTIHHPYSVEKMTQIFEENKDDFYNTAFLLRALVMTESSTGSRQSVGIRQSEAISTSNNTSQENADELKTNNLEIIPINVLLSEELRQEVFRAAYPLFEHTAIETVDAHSDQIGFWYSSDMGVEHLIVYREDGKKPHGVFFNLQETKQLDTCWYAIIVSD